jgi:adenylate cyclase, class 2
VRNVELKYELCDPDTARGICRELGARHAGTLHQVDSYYRVAQGRLKRRECVGRADEWILYERPDQGEAKLSRYTILDAAAAESRFAVRGLPVWLMIDKLRDLWLIDGVRIHLDQVRDLGWYFELEALVRRGREVAACHRVVESLRATFARTLGKPIPGGYSDLLAGRTDLIA